MCKSGDNNKNTYDEMVEECIHADISPGSFAINSVIMNRTVNVIRIQLSEKSNQYISSLRRYNMEYNELVALAESGDTKAMQALGHFHSDFGGSKENVDLDKAEYWMEKSAECGDVKGMILTALLCNMDGHVLMQIAPQEWEHAIPKMKKALFWAEQALNVGATDAAESCIQAKAQLGRAYMYGGMFSSKNGLCDDTAIKYLTTSLNYLKEVYGKTKTDDSLFYLGNTLFYLNNYMQRQGKSLKNGDDKLMITCLEKYVHAHNYTDSNVGMAYGFLGLLYTFGFGCQIDYSKAVGYYTIATEKCNFDCSDDLKHFKKKLFGGYTYIK